MTTPADYQSTLKSHLAAKHSSSTTTARVVVDKPKSFKISSIRCPKCSREFTWSFYQKKHRKLCIGEMDPLDKVVDKVVEGGSFKAATSLMCLGCSQSFPSKLGKIMHLLHVS